jgi:hypothetical protein
VDRPVFGRTHGVGGADTDGIAWIHPRREGRSLAQIGKKGKSKHRWIVGGKRWFLLNQWGVMCAWDCATANVYMVVLATVTGRWHLQTPGAEADATLLRPNGDEQAQ